MQSVLSSSGLDFPSFSEGLSLRARWQAAPHRAVASDFPSFSEGLSLREPLSGYEKGHPAISLPFRRDFH